MLLPIQWVVAVLTAGAVHELGHLAAIWASGGRVWSISILPTGARIETESMEPKTELWCALAGPIAGSLLLLFWRWMPRLAFCALIQTAFNLLPLYPMDGGRALRAVGSLTRKRSCKSNRFGVQ